MQNSPISTNGPILKSYCLAKKRLGQPLSDVDIITEIKSKNLAWIHLDANHDKTKTLLTKECEYLDSIIINALLAEETRPRVECVNDGLFLIVRCVNLNDNSDPEDMISIRMWIDPHRIITIEKRNTKSINDVETSILSGNAPKTSGDFLCLLLSCVFNKMEPILGSLDEIMDNVEEELIENPTTDLRNKLTNIRKQAIIFRRYMIPQRDAFSNLRTIDLKWLNDLHRRKLQENYDHATRYVEDLDALRERAQIIKDELSNLLTDKINKNMYVLSVIAAIFLPLGFLTGLLGINVGGIPGTDSPHAFYIFSGSLFFLVVIQVILFKKWKWF
ncbi:MAG: zinc transporter ZntB [Rickettsiales bacterium]|nr:zinc transporter ZntB [Rickettsiales bacterium]